MKLNMKQAERIQTSFVNAMEKKVLVWLAKHQPRWVTSDMLTMVGVGGALLVAVGFVLSNIEIHWLWLSSFGLVVNWYGDSLDGTLARVRDCQRPVYGYFLDHIVDCVNEAFMFIGAGLSPFLRLDLALMAYSLYLALTVNVSINAYLKGEFRLTYIKLGPTEFRLIVVIVNTLLIAIPVMSKMHHTYILADHAISMCILDYVAVVVILIMAFIFLFTAISDACKYAVEDPPKHHR